MRIVVQGYYGYRNLGDDLLCKIILEYFHDNFPNADFFVLSYASNPEYINRLVDFPIKVISNDKELDADVHCLGGGGVFFDFSKGKSWWINVAIKVLGMRTFGNVMKMLGKVHFSGITCGIGIGVGTFTESSDKFRSKMLQLACMDRLYVRDAVSLSNLRAVGYNGHMSESSDLAFLTDYWLDNLRTKRISELKNVAFILRDWKGDNSSYLQSMKLWVSQLEESGINCTVISYDGFHDQRLIAWSKEIGLNMSCWNPEEDTIADFCKRLLQFDLVVSSRAHGAIMAGCLGLPVMIVHLEDKLLQISRMFPESMALVDPFAPADLFIEEMKVYSEKFDSNVLNKEVDDNGRKIRASAEELSKFIRES